MNYVWGTETKYSCFEFWLEYVVSGLQENPDLWKWLTGQERPPESVKINPVRHDQEMKTQYIFLFAFLINFFFLEICALPVNYSHLTFPIYLNSIFTFNLSDLIGVYCIACQGYEQPQQPFCSRDTSNTWTAMGKGVGWYQERSR